MLFTVQTVNSVWTEFNRFLILGRVKEVHIKLLHRYYPCQEFLNKFRPDVSPLCSFCKEEVESFSHLFYGCLHSTNYWTQMYLLIWESYKDPGHNYGRYGLIFEC